MGLYEFENKRPDIHPSAFVHPEAVLIGDVELGADCYVGPGAVLRGDWGGIVVGPGSNIQENCVFHVLPDESVVLGPGSHIGHGAILHTCTLGVHVLVGMGAIIQDHAVIGDGAIISAGSSHKAGMTVPPEKLVIGVPGRIAGDVSREQKERSEWGTKVYQALPARCYAALRRVE